MKKFTLIAGLFDKETKRQEVNTIDAFKIVANIFSDITGGATINEGTGVYTHDDGTVVIEPSLICIVYNTSMDKMKRAADAIKTALNQASVIIEETETNSEFY